MKRTGRTRLIIECVICAELCFFSALFCVADRVKTARAHAAEQAVAEQVVTVVPEEETLPVPEEQPEKEMPEEAAEEPEEADPYAWDGEGAELSLDFGALLERNPDTVGWLHVPAVSISYPVLHYAGDNDYYLRRNFDGAYDSAGVIFLECTNRPDLNDRNSLIYGHNQADGTMFGRLHEFFSVTGRYEDCPYFYLYLPDGKVRQYLIFSYYRVETGTTTFSTIDNSRGYDFYTEYVQGLSEGEPVDVTFDHRPPIVTLSTCHGGQGTTRRFVVHGVLTGIAEAESLDPDALRPEKP